MGTMAAADAPSWSGFEEVDRIDRLYIRAQRMPVWPFDLTTFARFATIIGTVTLTVLLTWLLDKVLNNGVSPPGMGGL